MSKQAQANKKNKNQDENQPMNQEEDQPMNQEEDQPMNQEEDQTPYIDLWIKANSEFGKAIFARFDSLENSLTKKIEENGLTKEMKSKVLMHDRVFEAAFTQYNDEQE